MMELEAPVTDVAVAPWNPTYELPPSLVGTNVHHVGYGLNYKDVANDLNSRGAGVKREGNYPITGVLSTTSSRTAARATRWSRPATATRAARRS